MLDEPMREHAPTEPHAPTTSALMAEATAAHTAGDLAKAKALYQRLLALSPPSPEAAHGLGWLLVQEGDWRGALPCFARAIALRPWEKEFWISQLEALMQVGQHEAVHRLLHRATQSGIDEATVAGFESRLAERRLGLLAERVKRSGRSAAQAADAPRAELIALRSLFLDRRFAEARRMAQALVDRHPLCAFAWRVLGASLPAAESGTDDGLEILRTACDLDPGNIDVRMNLALALQESGRLEEAGDVYRHVLSLQPQNLRALVNHGLLLSARRDPAAEAQLRLARELGSSDPRVALALGAFLRDKDRCAEAMPLLEEALMADPTNDSALAALSVCCISLGRHAQAAALFRRLDSMNCDHVGALAIAIFVGSHLESVSAAELFGMHRQCGSLLEAAATPWDSWSSSRSPDRPLRVGFVSGDFNDHAIAKFLLPILRGVDRACMTLFAYSNSTKSDSVTDRFRQVVDGWYEACGKSDDLLAERIRRDEIDVLIDLSGHTAFNRLGVFARKPAPIQISWAGYPGTTGLSRMDYYLTDTSLVPPGLLDNQFSEALLLTEAGCPFDTTIEAPPVTSAPSINGSVFTFGSFNRISKLTPATLDLWAQVLRAAPRARLLIGSLSPDDQTHLAEALESRGISLSGVEFLPRMPLQSYLLAHSRVDLLLDTFPYSGGTTTCHGLWMGVPTLTLTGETAASRQSASCLLRVGLGEFVANSPDEFVGRAFEWSNQRSSLDAIRRGLRARVEASPLGRSRDGVHAFEDAVRAVWRRWCEGRPPARMVIPLRH